MTRYPDHNSVSEFRGSWGVYRGLRAPQATGIRNLRRVDCNCMRVGGIVASTLSPGSPHEYRRKTPPVPRTAPDWLFPHPKSVQQRDSTLPARIWFQGAGDN